MTSGKVDRPHWQKPLRHAVPDMVVLKRQGQGMIFDRYGWHADYLVDRPGLSEPKNRRSAHDRRAAHSCEGLQINAHSLDSDLALDKLGFTRAGDYASPRHALLANAMV